MVLLDPSIDIGFKIPNQLSKLYVARACARNTITFEGARRYPKQGRDTLLIKDSLHVMTPRSESRDIRQFCLQRLANFAAKKLQQD